MITTMQRTVTILLATYNGARHLPAQLDSLLSQTFTGWRLLVRDDGSTDATPAILADYSARFPDRITVLPDDGHRLGPSANFAALMAAADADYLMFCDQDDVWLPEKIGRTMAAMRDLEARHGRDLPLLVHTDLTVTDGQLATVAPSLWRYQHTDPALSGRLNRVLVQNYATGCTLLSDPTVIELNGEPTLLMHGDTLCTDDTEYQQFRALVRNPAWQQQFLARPIAERRTIAANLRETSRQRTGEKAAYIMDVNPQAVEATLRTHGVCRLIHGHTHRPAVHDLNIDGKPVRRIVLGDWYEQGSVLRCDGDGLHLETLPLSK